LFDSFNDINALQNEIRLKLGFLQFSFFKMIGIDSTLSYLEKLSKIINREKKNSYLLSDKSLYRKWRSLYDFCRGYIDSRERPVDEPGSPPRSFRYDIFENAAQEEYHNKMTELMTATQKKRLGK